MASWRSRAEPVILLSHRAPSIGRPVPAQSTEERSHVDAAMSGPVAAVEPLIRACSGVWVAHGSGEPEIKGPTAYRVRHVALEDEDERSRFYGFTNEALWPMCHRAHVKPQFRPDDFTTYWTVNARFADAVCEEANGPAPLVLVQDYHFALAPLSIRERLPASRIIAFWHVPWPHWQDFEICPWGRHLLEGLLGSNIVGFQTPLDCKNFIETVERCLGAHVDRYQDALTFNGRQVLVRAYPTSIRWPGRWSACSPSVQVCRTSIRRQLRLEPETLLGVGVDRLDYTKGIEEKFLAIERLLECYPEFRQRFVYAQLAAPSRIDRPAYRELSARVLATSERINNRFGTGSYRPILLLENHHAASHVNIFLRAADFYYLGSLHEGMNLMAKEFVAARDDERGVLVLSMFAGAARELTDALSINPYDIDDVASVLARALTMPDDEQADRMRRLRSVISEFSAYRWAAQLLSDAARLRPEH